MPTSASHLNWIANFIWGIADDVNADPSDDEIMDQVLNNWNPYKRRFGRDLAWMREPDNGNLIPTGFEHQASKGDTARENPEVEYEP